MSVDNAACPVLPQQKARMSLTHATLTDMADRNGPPLRAEKFLDAISFSARLSRLRFDQPLQLGVLQPEIFRPLRLARLKPTILFTPAKVGLLRNRRFFARPRCCLPIRYRHFNLTKPLSLFQSLLITGTKNRGHSKLERSGLSLAANSFHSSRI